MYLKQFLKNPLSIWIIRFIRNVIMEFKYRNKKLKIGYMSVINNVKFGIYNTIYDNVSLNNVILGNFTYITSNTSISNAKIGKFCSIGPNCKIGLGKHPTEKFVSTHPIFFSTLEQSQITFSDRNYFEEFDNIEIGNDVWIGSNVIIVDGIKIGDGVIIGAGAVVTKNIPPYAIVGGVPARVIKYRFDKGKIKKLLEMRWWDWDIKEIKENYLKFHNIEAFIQLM